MLLCRESTHDLLAEIKRRFNSSVVYTVSPEESYMAMLQVGAHKENTIIGKGNALVLVLSDPREFKKESVDNG